MGSLLSIDPPLASAPVPIQRTPLVGALCLGERPQSGLVQRPFEGAIEAMLAQFAAVSLEATNKSSRMLKRTDSKYILCRDEFISVLENFRENFRVLEIGEKNIFMYRSCYFDDNYKCYYEHHQGKRQRFKVRIRHYVDSDELFFEVKLKDKRGKTNKKRISCSEFAVSEISDEKLSMLRSFYLDIYHKEFRYDLHPALIVSYKRITLVSVHGGERVTIDLDLGFKSIAGSSVQISDDFIIVETKSADGRGVSNRALKDNHIRKVMNCSKYCIGSVLSGNVNKYNRFRPIIKTLQDKIAV